jgi:hypothetical protein
VSTTRASLPPLSAQDKARLVVEILRMYVAARWQMRHSDVREMVGHLRVQAPGDTSLLPLAQRLGKAVARTLSFLPTDNRCLVRSLVLDAMLVRRGLRSVLIVAVRSEPDFAAHAWVEHDGVPLLAPGSQRYQRLIEL